MKKLIYVFLLIVLLTGCTAEYTLNIEDDNFIENISITFPTQEYNKYKNLIDMNQYVKNSLSSSVIYNKQINNNKNNTIVNYKHSYSLNEFKESTDNKCFQKFKVFENDNYYSIIAEDFSCFDSFEATADSYKINIKTKYNVIVNNADSYKQDTYTWNFNKKNYKNKKVIFQFSKQEKKPSILDNIIPLIISMALSIIIIIFVLTINKYKNNNRTKV